MTLPILVIALGVAGVVGALMFIMTRDDDKTAERIGALVSGRRAKSDPGTDIMRQGAMDSDKKTLLGMITPNIPSLQKAFEQADCTLSPAALVGIGLIVAAVGMSLSMILSLRGLMPLAAAPLFGILLFTTPFLWLLNKRRARLSAFAYQLPDTLELLARALRSGQSLAAGFQVIAEEMPPPVCDEFNRVYQEQNMGIAIDDALRNMCERVPNLDLRFFVTSVAIQRQTGGDLAEILDKIGYVIRERFKILGQVKALTGEGRLSGVVLVALPFGLFIFMFLTQREYVKDLWEKPLGRQMSAWAIVAQIFGAYVIKKIVDIKV